MEKKVEFTFFFCLLHFKQYRERERGREGGREYISTYIHIQLSKSFMNIQRSLYNMPQKFMEPQPAGRNWESKEEEIKTLGAEGFFKRKQLWSFPVISWGQTSRDSIVKHIFSSLLKNWNTFFPHLNIVYFQEIPSYSETESICRVYVGIFLAKDRDRLPFPC